MAKQQSGINRSFRKKFLSSVEQIFSILIHFYKAHCIYFFNCIAQNKFIYGPTWTKKEKNSSIFHDYYWLHYTPEEEDGVLNFDDRECMFACIADCSYVVTSLAPSTLQFRVERRRIESDKVETNEPQKSQLYRERFLFLFL